MLYTNNNRYLLPYPSDPPGAPGVPQIGEVKDGKVPLTWTPPEDDGGAPVTGYVLEYRPEGALKWVKVKANIPDPAFTVTGLDDDTQYEFRVAAENKAGVGPCSEGTMPVKAKEEISKHFFFGLFLVTYIFMGKNVDGSE